MPVSLPLEPLADGARSHFQPHPTPGTILHPPGQWQWAVPDTSAVPIHMTTAHPGYYGTVPVVTQPPPIALPLFIPTLPAVSTLHSPASWSSNNASTTTAASSASASPHPPGPSEPPPTQAQQLPNAIGSGRVTPLHQPHPPEHMPPAPTRASTPDVTDAGDSASVGEASVAL